MKQIFTTITLFAMALSFASCEKEIIVNCDCNCQCGNSDQNNKPGNDNNGGANDNNNDGNNGGNNDGDRSDYEIIPTITFTQGVAGYFGVYYDDQPNNTTNWFVELAEDNYDLNDYEGTGYNIALELFASGTSMTSIPAGTYSVEAYNENPCSAGSLLYGYIDEYIDEDNQTLQYPAGTWLFDGNDGVAGATAGEVEIKVSGSTYTINFELFDDEYQIAFSGTYSGSLTFYDGTEEYSLAQATKSKSATLKRYRVRL